MNRLFPHLFSLLLISLLVIVPAWSEQPSVLSGSVKQTITQNEPGIVGLDMRILPGGVSYPLITGVFPGTPAFKRGIQRGDLIMEIDNESTLGKSDAQIDSMISDIPGTRVLFTLLRAGRILKLQLDVAAKSSVTGF